MVPVPRTGTDTETKGRKYPTRSTRRPGVPPQTVRGSQRRYIPAWPAAGGRSGTVNLSLNVRRSPFRQVRREAHGRCGPLARARCDSRTKVQTFPSYPSARPLPPEPLYRADGYVQSRDDRNARTGVNRTLTELPTQSHPPSTTEGGPSMWAKPHTGSMLTLGRRSVPRRRTTYIKGLSGRPAWGSRTVLTFGPGPEEGPPHQQGPCRASPPGSPGRSPSRTHLKAQPPVAETGLFN